MRFNGGSAVRALTTLVLREVAVDGEGSLHGPVCDKLLHDVGLPAHVVTLGTCRTMVKDSKFLLFFLSVIIGV